MAAGILFVLIGIAVLMRAGQWSAQLVGTGSPAVIDEPSTNGNGKSKDELPTPPDPSGLGELGEARPFGEGVDEWLKGLDDVVGKLVGGLRKIGGLAP